MNRPLALLRPEPGWSVSAAAARGMGIEVAGHALFEAEALAWAPPAGTFDALLVGSAAVCRMGGARLGDLVHLPVHAVGAATAAAARAAGFTVARVGEGGLQRLLDDQAGERRRFLRLCGEARVSVVPNPGQEIVDCAVYRMRPLPLTRRFADCLDTRHPLIALHSAAAARHFAQEFGRLGLDRRPLHLLALGPRILEAAGPGWGARHVAEHPDDAALLAKAAALCQ